MNAADSAVPPQRVFWRHSWRIIPTHQPYRRLYERVAESADEPTLLQLEQLTNDRVRHEEGKISLLRAGDHFPPRASPYLTWPFSNRRPSRFSDGRYGVYYAAKELPTAIAETKYHREVFMKATRQAPLSLRMLVIVAQLKATLHDLRAFDKRGKTIYAPTNYAPGQKMAGPLWNHGSQGVLCRSVRREGGECVGIFSPQTLFYIRRERCLEYAWDGTRIASVSTLSVI
jgi:hypothetical protein